MSDNLKALELLFQRPLEPVFTTRDNGKAALEVPQSFFTGRYNGADVALLTRAGDDAEVKITVQDIPKPNIEFAMEVDKKQTFSLFNDNHRRIAGMLIQLFLGEEDLGKFVSLVAYVKDRINAMLFQYAYTVVVQHRKDTGTVQIPSIAEQFPANFVEPSVFMQARAEATLLPGEVTRLDIPQNFTATDKEDEQRMAYFREDMGINIHHWHWHLVYPADGPDEVVRKDRRGELFYYMHHQVMARYNLDRFSNGLPKTKPLNNLREEIPEGYFPKIISSLNNRTYPARNSGQKLSSIDRDENKIEIAEVERWADRIHQGIDQGYLVDTQNRQTPLDETTGIDVLVNTLEASKFSVNRQLYGNLHNMGHNLISLAHDPDGRHLEDVSIMGDVSTSMRDPSFFRWHTYIDEICTKFKNLLPEYSQQQLEYHGVNVDSVKVQISVTNARENTLLTYWQKSDINIGAALDFGPNGEILASFTHLQHAPFDYTIQVTNTGGFRLGTCRIFLSPKTDERGRVLKMAEARLLAIELDKFTVRLRQGQNVIRRRSNESSVTIPFERSFRRIGPQEQPTDTDELATFRFCGCGWPQHLLLPKGNETGLEYDLFVMISNYADDEVVQRTNTPDVCGDAYSFCGLKDKLYPDKRSMGYPFDRTITSPNLGAFADQYTNMRVATIKVQFVNRYVKKT